MNMKQIFYRLIMAALTSLFVIGKPTITVAAVTAPWSTTFNCQEWNQTQGIYPPAFNCDGLEGAGGQLCAGTTADQVTTPANYPNGGGGRGFRHYIGDGQNVNGAGLGIIFSSPLPEFWFRWYMRYSSGFQWSPLGYQKLIYPTNIGSIWDFTGPDNWQLTAGGIYTATGHGWSTTQAAGSTQATGTWHWYEVHYKRDTNGTDGIFEAWSDGALVISRSNINHGAAGASFNGFGLLTNQNAASNGGCVAVDLDDFALSTTGFIGPITGLPSPPQNLRVN